MEHCTGRSCLQCRRIFGTFAQGKRVRAVWKLCRSRAIFTARRKQAKGKVQGDEKTLLWRFNLVVRPQPICLSANWLRVVTEGIIAVGNCGFRRHFLWGRKSNEFAEYEASSLFLPTSKNRSLNRYHKSADLKTRKIKKGEIWSSTIKNLRNRHCYCRMS